MKKKKALTLALTRSLSLALTRSHSLSLVLVLTDFFFSSLCLTSTLLHHRYMDHVNCIRYDMAERSDGRMGEWFGDISTVVKGLDTGNASKEQMKSLLIRTLGDISHTRSLASNDGIFRQAQTFLLECCNFR